MRFLPLVLVILCIQFGLALPVGAAPQQLQLGRYSARAIFEPAKGATPAPAVLLLPGSGSAGPEQMAPADVTLSGKDEPTLSQFASAFQAAGYATLQLGKPGVDFAQPGKTTTFYDQDRFNALTWSEYLDHISDAVTWLAGQPGIDPSRVYVLGHSEGTDAAVDIAERYPQLVRGVFLLGYSGQDFEHVVAWQLFERELDSFFVPSVDLDHDGRITHAEIAPWEDSFWFYQIPEGQSFTLDELLAKLHGFRDWLIPGTANYPLWKDVYSRGSDYARVAALKQSVRVFTGEHDVQTPAKDSRLLVPACAAAGKADCVVTIVPGLGHAFSAPRPPRAQPLIDATWGPVAPSFLEQLHAAAAEEAAR